MSWKCESLVGGRGGWVVVPGGRQPPAACAPPTLRPMVGRKGGVRALGGGLVCLGGDILATNGRIRERSH